MAEIWPPALNYVLDRGSFSIDPHSDIARTEFDDGPQLVRVRFSNPTTVYNGTITLTNNEFILFRGFYMNTLNQGSKWFEMPVWDGASYASHKARFSKKYEIRDEAWDQYTLSVSLEVREYPSLDGFALYLIGLYGIDFVLNEMADPLQKIVNIDYPEVMANLLTIQLIFTDPDDSNDYIFIFDDVDDNEYIAIAS
jgi:hypothetical protein